MILVKILKTCALVFVIISCLSVSASFAEEAVLRKVLENGLVLLVKESPPKDLVSINISVRAGIGSEEEYTGTGISHLIEHMVFKGTRTRKAGSIEKEISSFGGMLDGMVSGDLTTYTATVPADCLSKALSILKDMLLNAAFDEKEIEKEKEVIIKEINMNKDDPEKSLILSLFNNAYLRHPYKYPPIGYEKLLRSLTRNDLVKFYNKRYVPNRIVVSVVGGIDRNDAASAIEKEFADFRTADFSPVKKETEPPQTGKRRADIESNTTLSYLAMGFHSTGILDKDLFTMDVLSMILGRGESSLLNKKLVKETLLAYSVSAVNYTPQDPGLFIITATLSEQNIEAAEKEVMAAISMIAGGALDDKDIEKAKSMVSSDYILLHETIEAQADVLSEGEAMTGNHDFFRAYLEGVKKVTKNDLKRAASVYLNEDNLTLVRMVPKKEAPLSVKKESSGLQDTIEKKELSNGLKILVRRDTKVPAVSISVAFSGGLFAENKADNGISNLVSRMLLKGTRSRTEAQITGAVEAIGGNISAFSGLSSFGLNATVLKDDLDSTLSLLKDIIANSVFNQKELDTEKSLIAASRKEEDDDIFQRGFLELRKNLFNGHPYSMRYSGEIDSMKRISRDDAVRFYSTYCAPNNTVISVSGDIDPAAVSLKKIEELFKDMQRKTIPPAQAGAVALDGIKKFSLKMDREEALIMLGFKTIAVDSLDRFTLDVLEGVLSGMSGRIFKEIRDKMALAYALGCMQKRGVDTGFMMFYIATTKEKSAQALSALLAQIKNIREKSISEEEMSSAKREIILNHESARQTNDYCSVQSALDELYGLGYDEMYRYKDGINKVTKDDLQRAAKKYLDLNAYTEVIITPD